MGRFFHSQQASDKNYNPDSILLEDWIGILFYLSTGSLIFKQCCSSFFCDLLIMFPSEGELGFKCFMQLSPRQNGVAVSVICQAKNGDNGKTQLGADLFKAFVIKEAELSGDCEEGMQLVENDDIHFALIFNLQPRTFQKGLPKKDV